MSTTTVPFDLYAWRERMGAQRGSAYPITQAEAAAYLGITLLTYKTAERRQRKRPGVPCTKMMMLLAQQLERRQAS